MNVSIETLKTTATASVEDLAGKFMEYENNALEKEMVIKSEITLEPEEVTEVHILRLPNEQLAQVEICSKQESENSEEEPFDKRDFEEQSFGQSQIESEVTGLEYDTKLSEIMSDHNYTYQQISQSEAHSIKKVRDILMQCFFPKIISANQFQNVPNPVLDFVEKTVNSIQSFKRKGTINEQDINCTNNEQDYEFFDASPEFPPYIITNNEFSLNMDGKDKCIGKNAHQQTSKCPEHCSETTDFYQCVDFLKTLNNKSHSKTCTKDVLKKLMDFAKSLYSDCNTFYLATSSEGELLNDFIVQQFTKFKKLVNMEKSLEKSVQTDSIYLARKRMHLNLRAKRKMLLESFHLSESTSDENSCISAKNSDASVDSKMSSYYFPIERLHSQLIVKKINDLEYDDGVDLSKYIQSDIFKSEEYQNLSPWHGGTTQTDSEKENRMKPSQIWSENDGDDITDKEIDRLTNLNCLKKRQIRYSNNFLETGKLGRGKSLSHKTNSVIDMWDNDFDNDSSSKSIHQSEEEITENEFKSRYNAHIKKELLNDSTTEDDDSEGLSTDLPKHLSTYEDDDENNPLLVDTFLENFTIEENDDNDEKQENVLSDIEAADKSENKKDVLDSHINSDESKILRESLDSHKQKKEKSLLEMISEADKRNSNGNEEIVLSSESDYSDAADVEPIEEKSRIIKPMLRPDQLANETRKAQKMETDRIKKLEKQQTMLAKAIKSNVGKVDSGDVVLDYIEEKSTFIKVDPEIVKHLKRHQIDGVKFMYECCYGGVHALRKNSGSGCILAHCMGLGKTLQLIALIHTAVSYIELKTIKVLVLCPKSTVMNWADEIQRWLSPLKKGRRLRVFAFAEPSDITDKLNVLEEWSKSTPKCAGCLLLGYEAFRTLVFYHSYKNRGNLSAQKLKEIKEKVDTYLLKPGADLVVCDEGHIIKNSKSAISLAVGQITTPKRIILTGTPIQNNLKEYYSMVNFIKPLYLGTEKEFANLYANPIKNGQHKDSSKMDIKVMKQRSFVLHKKLSKFVQRKETELLKSFLPAKLEYVLFVPMTSVQSKLYEHILGAISSRGDYRGKSLITDYTCLRKIWTHPKVLEDAWKNATNQKNKNERKSNPLHSDDDQPDDIYDSQTGVMSVTNDWWRNLLNNKDLETIMPSNKMRTMFEILRMCEEKGEKCLIFSAFVAVLNVVEYFFSKITKADPETLQQISFPLNQTQKVSNMWIRGQDYYRLDGKTPKAIRHEMIKRFNSSTNTRARVFLISSKAGGQGINLTGANRVIILDTSWNPSNDQQNIFRIFRLGQKKICYIYRLLAMGTMEEKVYSRSVTKQAMSFRVVDEQQIDRHYNMAELAELYTLTKPNDLERPMPILPKDSILASLLMNHPDVVHKYHEHDSLLENKVEQELSEQEKADAWATYERELQMNSETQEVAANIERMQNNFIPAKMPNYMAGSLSSLQMQAFLNYSMYNPQSTQDMLPYNYTANSQQYLETLNAYQNLAFNYADLNTPTQNGVFTPATSMYNSVNAQKFMSPNMALLSGMHHGGVSPSNALSALGDLSRLGLHHATKMYNDASAFMPPLPPGHMAKYPSTAMQPNPNLATLNAGYSSYIAKSLEKEKQLNVTNEQLYLSGVLPQNNALSAKQHLHSSSPMSESTAASKDSTEQATAAALLSKKQAFSKSMSNIFPHAKNSQQTPLPADSNVPVNMGIMYPYAKEISKSSKSEDFLKKNSEMQIIPTTSPPGTSSISKQLNEIEPNISLTAVRNLNIKPASSHHNVSSDKSCFNVANESDNKSGKQSNLTTLSRPAIEATSKNTVLTPTMPINASSSRSTLNATTESASLKLAKTLMAMPAPNTSGRRDNTDKLNSGNGKSNYNFNAKNSISNNPNKTSAGTATTLEPIQLTKSTVCNIEKQSTNKPNQSSSNIKKTRKINSTMSYETVPPIHLGAGILSKGTLRKSRSETYAITDKRMSSSLKSEYGQTKLNLPERKRKVDDITNITDAKHQKLTNETKQGRSLAEVG